MSGLHKNALSSVDSVIMAIAGTAPAYSLTASTATLVAAVGLAGPGALLYAAIPIFGISFAFFYLNRWRSDAGAAYSWVGRSISPSVGFMVGWAFLSLSTVFMVAASVPAGVATIDLIAPSWNGNVPIATAAGAVWFIGVTALTVTGINVTARFQKLMTFIEVGGLALIAIAGFIVFSRHPVHAFSIDWFSPAAFHGIKPFMAGMVVATFYYFGWDVSANLSEETKDANAAPGLGGVLGMVGVFILFEAFQVSVQMGLRPEEIAEGSANLLPIVGARVLPYPLGSIGVLAVLVSTVATLETQLLQCSRTLFSMSRDRVIGPQFAELSKRYQTPSFGSIVVAGISLILFVVSSQSASIGKLMTGLINAVGVQVTLYYGITGIACAWYYRRSPVRDPRVLLMRVIWPLASSLLLIVVGIYQIPDLGWSVSIMSFSAIAVGVVPLMYYRAKWKAPFYTDPTEMFMEGPASTVKAGAHRG